MANKIGPGSMINSAIGSRRLDDKGTAIGAALMDPAKGYGPIPHLLQEYINQKSENAWKEIKHRIDNVFVTVGAALEALEHEISFAEEIQKQIQSGKKLFFKVNLVVLPAIDYSTHAPVMTGVHTPWGFTAAVMRWFHDELGITYHQMCVGEAGTTTFQGAAIASRICGETISTEAVLEGKYGNNFGGWGFYFTRKYLAECHDKNHTDDPMDGYQESLDGVCLAPGKTPEKLLLYDLNKIDRTNGRNLPVVGGINSKIITMHKVVVGGNPDRPKDREEWPGSVIISLPKLKIHTLELFTSAVKNIGMGFYSTAVNASKVSGKYEWKYAIPDLKMPFIKMKMPHFRWLVDINKDTLQPLRDKNGNYKLKKTGGMEANMADVIQALKSQGIMILHVVDAIETTNIHHCGPPASPVQEGLVLAGMNAVALDSCGSRYLFSMVPLNDLENIRRKHKISSDVIQKVPMPELDGNNITSGEGYDSPFERYHALAHCEKRDLGKTPYHVIGTDLRNGHPLASLKQHLGRIEGEDFKEIITGTLYQTPNKPLYDLQKTIFTYLELDDKLTGSINMQKIKEYFDENNDGIIDYMERGQNVTPIAMALGNSLMNQKLTHQETLKLRFLLAALQIKLSSRDWNLGNHDIEEHTRWEQALSRAFAMSLVEVEQADPIVTGRKWGNGKWPSFQFALQLTFYSMIYGQNFPERFDPFMAPYGLAFNYADYKWNRAEYCTVQGSNFNLDIIGKYHDDIKNGKDLLPFILYVPKSLGHFNGLAIPNVKETEDAGLILTASFKKGEEWNNLHLSEFSLE